MYIIVHSTLYWNIIVDLMLQKSIQFLAVLLHQVVVLLDFSLPSTYVIKHKFLDVPNVMTCRYPRYVYYEGIFNLMTNSFTEISYVCVVDQPLKSLCVVTLFPSTNL